MKNVKTKPCPPDVLAEIEAGDYSVELVRYLVADLLAIFVRHRDERRDVLLLAPELYERVMNGEPVPQALAGRTITVLSCQGFHSLFQTTMSMTQAPPSIPDAIDRLWKQRLKDELGRSNEHGHKFGQQRRCRCGLSQIEYRIRPIHEPQPRCPLATPTDSTANLSREPPAPSLG